MYVQGLEKIKGECRVGHVTTAVQVLRMVFLKKRRGKSVVVYIKWVCHPYVGSATALPDTCVLWMHACSERVWSRMLPCKSREVNKVSLAGHTAALLCILQLRMLLSSSVLRTIY